MSIRWHFMSKRPSSNTANRPTGPAPMMATSVFAIVVLVIAPPKLLPPATFSGSTADGQSPGSSSTLLLGHLNDEAVQLVPHLDLAGQPRIGAHVEGEVQ